MTSPTRHGHLVVICSAVAVAAAPAAALAVELAPGISYDRIEQPGPQVVHVLAVRPGPLVRLGPALTAGSPAKRGTLTSLMQSLQGAGAVAGVNGDYFNLTDAYPSGVLSLPTELVSEPEPTRSAMVLGLDGALQVLRLQLAGRYQWLDPAVIPPPPIRTFGGMNRPFERTGETVVFTPRYGPTTLVGAARTEALIALDGGAPLVANQPLQGTVVSVVQGTGGTPIGVGQIVIAGNGSAATNLTTDLAPGRRVSIEAAIAGIPPQGQALGGGPMLVQAGVPIAEAGEGFTRGQIDGRTARTAVGQRADGTFLLVTTEGPQQGRVGFNMAEQGQLMASFGAVTAVGMDAGGSALMSIDDRLAIPWASERPITDALVVSYLGVRIGTLPISRLSPNRDGVDDALDTFVRTPTQGTLRVVVRRRGTVQEQVLLEGPVTSPSAPVRVDPVALGIADGPYVVSADLTPADGSPASSQRRPFIVDRTLGSLALRPFRAPGKARAVDVAFTLSRPARVTMVVARSDGRVLRVPVANRALKRGRHHLSWDATVRRTAAAGSFLIRVEAKTFLGTTGLNAPVALRAIPEATP